MNALSKRLAELEAAGDPASKGVLILRWGGEDDQGNPVSETISVTGYGWSASRLDDETEDEFRRRAELLAEQNGYSDLWARTFRQVTIGGEQ